MPDKFQIYLFGRFKLQDQYGRPCNINMRKPQELLSYLLLHRDRYHAREQLAHLIWENVAAKQSKKYLRQAIWQLQNIFNHGSDAPEAYLLRIEADWLACRTSETYWLDIEEFENTYTKFQNVRGQELNQTQAEEIQKTVQLYQGDLLSNWYHEWCLYERERLQNIYLALLDKLIGYCESHQEYAQGVTYGSIILRYDRARERTHRRLMRLHILSGNRTAAIRQFNRCVAALDEELGVVPSKRSINLYDQIRLDQSDNSGIDLFNDEIDIPDLQAPISSELLPHFKRIHAIVINAQRQLEKEIYLIESKLHHN